MNMHRLTIMLFALYPGPVFSAFCGSDSLLTLTNADHAYPNWSPDGTQIVFTSDMLDGNHEIYLMNADGSNVLRLTVDRWDDFSPVWSPDGRSIVFGSIRRNGKHDVYLMDSDSSNIQNVTNNPTSLDNHPKFTPDGTKIVFKSSRNTPRHRPEERYDYKISEMNLDGTGLKRLTYCPEGWDSYPSVSPDGSKLLWRRIVPINHSDSGNSEIFVANRDGSNPRNLTGNPGFDGYPAWSPNGKHIIFSSTRCQHDTHLPPGLFIMDASGLHTRRITESAAGVADIRPWFSPDGREIVFNRIYIKENRTEIVRMNLDDPTY